MYVHIMLCINICIKLIIVLEEMSFAYDDLFSLCNLEAYIYKIFIAFLPLTFRLPIINVSQ